jgi:hypothetical protein
MMTSVQKIRLTGAAACLVACSVGLSGEERAARSPVLTSISKYQSVYVTSDTSPRSSDSRIEFDGLHFRFSGSGYSSSERKRSEFGGVSVFGETKQYYFMEQLVIYVPKPGVDHWTDGKLNCAALKTSDEALKISCTAQPNGSTYDSMYSYNRGFEWFDQSCNNPTRVCRYILKSKSGVLSSAMLTSVARTGAMHHIHSHK